MTTPPPGKGKRLNRDWTIRLTIAALAIVITAMIGPFATYNTFSFPQRLLYWGGLIFGLLLPAYFIRKLVFQTVTLPQLQLDVLGAIVLAVILGPSAWAFNVYVVGFDVANPLMFWEHVGVVLLICLLTVAARAYAHGTAQPDALIVPDPPILRRLESAKRGALLRISADGHQLLILTDRGESRIRMRFSDALEELETVEGVCIHRSHWVALSQIVGVELSGRRHAVRLVCGGQLPVSPTGIKALRNAGIGMP